MKLRDAACAYADRGWAVFPLAPGKKFPAGRLVPHGQNEATTDLATVFTWWQRQPNLNIGINCERSGLVVVDIDPRNGGDDGLHDLARELGPLPVTVESLSGGGGQHLLFQMEQELSFRKQLADGVDIKHNGYIVAPPSVHPSGGCYEWSVDGDPDEVEPARLPVRWLAAMTAQRRRAETPRLADHSRDDLKRIPAADYIYLLAGRPADGEGWVQCPFHKGGQERTPSLKADGTLWACYACDPIGGRRVMGGNIFDLAALLWNIPVPLDTADYMRVRGMVERKLER